MSLSNSAKNNRACANLTVALFAAFFLAYVGDASANPSPPVTRLLTAVPVTPTAAATFYGSGTLHSVGLPTLNGQEPEIDALAYSLLAGRDVNVPAQKTEYVQAVFDWVRNNIDTEFRYGLSKGGRGALIDESGTSFDQAELMIKLLRKNGVAASYGLGDIQISGTQFGLWTGLAKQLVQSTQAFTVDAKQACKLMADGGIPGIINNQSGLASCDTLSGDLSTITMGHIWVKVGSTIYDPSFKQYYLKTGIDLPAAMGCGTATASTCGSGAQSATTGAAATGTANGATYIEGYSPNAGIQHIGTLATNLQNYIKTTDRTLAVLDLLGGRDLVPQTGTIAAVYTERLSWSGEVPNQYRTLYSTDSEIMNTAAVSYAFYADEIAARRVVHATMVAVDDVQLTVGANADYSPATARRTFAAVTCTGRCVTITVDHPYAAASGQYADEKQAFKLVDDPTYEAGFYRPFNSVTGLVGTAGGDATAPAMDFPEKSNAGMYPIVFIHEFGQAGLDALKNATDKFNVTGLGGTTCATGSTTGVVQTGCGNDAEVVTAATVNPYRTQMDQLVDGVAGTLTTRHHDIGIVYASKTPEISRITLQESLSIAARSGNEVDRRAGYNIQAITLSEVEGMVAPLEYGAQFSFASMFFKKNALPLNGSTGIAAGRVYLISPANMATFLASQPDAFPTPAVHGSYPDGWTCGTECWRKSQLQSIANQGYSTLIMAGGQSELFFDASSSAQDKKAYTIWEYMKGGAAVADPFQTAIKTTEVIDAASKARKQLSLSKATGDLSYQAEPDIVTGAGNFPYSLPFVRTFHTTFRDRIKAQSVTTEPRDCTQDCGLQTHVSHSARFGGSDGVFHDRLGGGWDHNYNISLTFTNNPVRGLGAEYAMDGAANIARLRVIRDLATNTDPNTSLASQVTIISAAIYMGYSSDAVVKIGSSSDSLRAGVDGWYSTKTPNAKLFVSAQNPGPTEYTYTSANGDNLIFDKLSVSMVEVDPTTGALTPRENGKTWLPSRWNFPDGVVVSFSYVLVPYASGDESVSCQYAWGWSCSPWRTPAGYRLTTVSNNLGRSLTFSNNGSITLQSYINTTVTDENGRQAVFTNSGCSGMGSSFWYGITSTCNQFTATDAGGSVTRYEYAPNTTLSGIRNNYRLIKIFTPSNATVPFQSIDYDALGRVLKVTDRNNRSTFYYSGGLNGNERWKPTFMVSPGLERTYSIHNDKSSEVYSRSPMGRITTKVYDNAERLIRTVMPEGNAVEQRYDVRGNVTRTCKISELRAGLPCDEASTDIVSKAVYMEGPSILACVNSVICNKPSVESDGLGKLTNYTWNATTGNLTQVLMPSDRTGVRPQTDLDYTACLGVSLMTSKTEKISSTRSVLTTYANNASNHCVLQQAVTDSGGLNLTTALVFDAVGNLTSADGPLPGTADTTTYQWNTDRTIKSIVSPDPDGAGVMLRKMVQYTYNGDGWITRTDTGTATSAAGAGFTVLTREIPTYDAMGNKTQSKVVKP